MLVLYKLNTNKLLPYCSLVSKMNNWKCNSKLHWQQEQCLFPKQFYVEACQTITDTSISLAARCSESISQEDNQQQAVHVSFFFFKFAVFFTTEFLRFILLLLKQLFCIALFGVPSHLTWL